MNITFCNITEAKLNSDIQKLGIRKTNLDKKKNKYQPITFSTILSFTDWIIAVFCSACCFIILSVLPKNEPITIIGILSILGSVGFTSFFVIMPIFLIESGCSLGIINILYTETYNIIISKINKYIDEDNKKLDTIISDLKHLVSIVQKVEEIYFLFISMKLDSNVDIQKENDKYKLIFSFSNPNINDIVPEGIELNENTVRCDDVLDIVIELSNDYAYNIVSKNKIDFSYLDRVYGMI